MIKFIIALAMALPLFANCGSGKCGSGCGTGKCGMSSEKPKKMNARFQSVSEKKAKVFQDKKYGSNCAICGMNIPKFYKTSHAAHTHGESKQYCSLHCLVDDAEYGQGDLEDKKVVAVDLLDYIPVKKAFYVIDSTKPATMSRVSKYAFSSKDAANKFIKKNGGKLASFDEAYKVALKDFE